MRHSTAYERTTKKELKVLLKIWDKVVVSKKFGISRPTLDAWIKVFNLKVNRKRKKGLAEWEKTTGTNRVN